jgi:Na+-transporting methylmalonyl-CoA/oxaloacetate decarboxylase gamma subunit
MENPLVIALTVSGVGLLILFGALVFLYGLMYAMTAIIRDRPDVKEEMPVPVVEADGKPAHVMQKVAVVAVALARAELESSLARSPEAEVGLSPWGQYHRHRLLGMHPRTRID